MRLLPKALLALIATTVTATVAVAQDKQPSWADVEAAAKKVGKITIYENWPPPGDELLFNEFAKAHPDIKVETVRLSSSALIQRFETEYSAGKSPADIFIVVWDDVLTRWAKDGWIRQWTPPELKVASADTATRLIDLYSTVDPEFAKVLSAGLSTDKLAGAMDAQKGGGLAASFRALNRLSAFCSVLPAGESSGSGVAISTFFAVRCSGAASNFTVESRRLSLFRSIALIISSA